MPYVLCFLSSQGLVRRSTLLVHEGLQASPSVLCPLCALLPDTEPESAAFSPALGVFLSLSHATRIRSSLLTM